MSDERAQSRTDISSAGGEYSALDDGGNRKDWNQEQDRIEKLRRRAERIYRRHLGSQAYAIGLSKPRWTPWLLIRYSATDLGLRPIPSGSAHYVSPDIWVDSGDPLGRPMAGQPNYVHARIFNLGMADAAPVQVDFFWANPALGAGPANMNLIGTAWVEVPSQTSTVVRCATPWVPEFVNDGHECLMVNCSNPVLDPILDEFHPRLDRHVGQRNLTVLAVQPSASITIPLDVNNLFPISSTTILTARLQHMVVANPEWIAGGDVEVLRDIIEFDADVENTGGELRNRLRNSAAPNAERLARVADSRIGQLDRSAVRALTRRRSSATVAAQWLDGVAIGVPESPHQWYSRLLAGAELLRSAHTIDSARDITIARLRIKPFEGRRVAIELGAPHDMRPGEVLSCELRQWQQGLLIGGYTVVMSVKYVRPMNGTSAPQGKVST